MAINNPYVAFIYMYMQKFLFMSGLYVKQMISILAAFKSSPGAEIFTNRFLKFQTQLQIEYYAQ